MKFKLDELSPEQWKDIVALADSLPNKFHTGKQGERFGNYLHVGAEPDADIDMHTGQLKIKCYRDVEFDIFPAYTIPKGRDYPLGYDKRVQEEMTTIKNKLINILLNF